MRGEAGPLSQWLHAGLTEAGLPKAIPWIFGRGTPIQHCQVHKARNIAERLPKERHASGRKTLRQAWEMDDAAKAEQLIWNLARRLEKDWPGISASILEGLEEILCVVRLELPKDLRRSLFCTNIIENMNGTIRQVTRNVKRWRDVSIALRETAAGMMEAKKGLPSSDRIQTVVDAQSRPAGPSGGTLGTPYQRLWPCPYKQGGVNVSQLRPPICNMARDISGLLVRSPMNAGQDGFRDKSSKQQSDLIEGHWVYRSVPWWPCSW